MSALVFTGFILGLSSSFHCMGMCGPIAMAIPVKRKNNWTILGGALQYNVGRIITYALLGAVVGSFGLTLNTFGILQWLSIIAGILLIAFAWRKYLERYVFHWLPTINIQLKLNALIGKVIRSKSPAKLLFLGTINGLLPCGMVFAALLNAILTGEVLQSSISMVAFGMGTLPAMLAVTFLTSKIKSEWRKKLGKAVPYLLTVVGVLVVLRGMNLNIPYISPRINMVQSEQPKTQEVKEIREVPAQEVEMSCCHSKEDCE